MNPNLELILHDLRHALGELRADVDALEAGVRTLEHKLERGDPVEAEEQVRREAEDAVRRWMSLDFTRADDLVGELTVVLAESKTVPTERRLRLVEPPPEDAPVRTGTGSR